MRVLLTGASGQLGAYLLQDAPSCHITAWSGTSTGNRHGATLHPVDLTNRNRVAAAFAAADPDVVLHAAAWSRVDRCYQQPELAEHINAHATAQLVELTAKRRARLIYVSTDMVFDGEKESPYTELDEPAPLSQYGRTKLRGEQFARTAANAAVARMSLLVGPARHAGASFFDQQCRALRAGHPIHLFTDEWRTPLDLSTAACALWALAMSDVTGLLHIGGPQRLSRWEIGHQLADLLNANAELLRPVTHDFVPTPEPRPRDLSLDSSRWRSLFPQIPWTNWTESLGNQLRS